MADFVTSQLDACALGQVCSYNDGLNAYVHPVKFPVVICSIWSQFSSYDFAMYVSLPWRS